MNDPAGADSGSRTGPPAWAPLPDHRVIEVAGADAGEFLHRMLTQDVRSIEAGSGRAALLLTVRGRVVGDPYVWSLGDRHALALDARAAEAVISALERYVIADDVTFADRTAEWTTGLHLLGEGPLSADPTPRSGVRPFGAWHARARLLRPEEAVALERELRAARTREVEGPSFDALRVEAMAPWFGAEIDDRILPNEAALDGAISWTKGCYLGQEPVVMAKHRGHPPTRLVRLEIAGVAVPDRDAPLTDGPRSVGRVTTAVRSADGTAIRALGFVRHDLATVGRRLSLEGRDVGILAVAGG